MTARLAAPSLPAPVPIGTLWWIGTLPSTNRNPALPIIEGETLSVDRSRWVMPDREPVTTITGEPT